VEAFGRLSRAMRVDKRKGSTVKIVALAIILAAGVIVAGTSVTQAPPGCEPNRICLYEDVGFRGQMWPISPGQSHLGPANDKASSVFNATFRTVPLYSDHNFGGSVTCLNPNTGIDNLFLFGHDAISSIGSGPAEAAVDG
jgi:hypothetical protein